MKVSWNPAKAESNLKSHGVRFSDAESVLFDPATLSFEDSDAEGEQRFVAIGRSALDEILVVVYTYREDHIRLISARRATRNEVQSYEEGI